MGLAEITLLVLLQDDPDTLVARLRSDDPDVRAAAFAKLRDLGRAALPTLEKFKDDPDSDLSGSVRRLIRRVEIAETMPPRLKQAAPDAADQLASNADADWLDVLLQLKRDAHRKLRTADVEYLAERAARAAEAPRDRKALCEAIASWGMARLAPWVKTCLADPDAGVREAAIVAWWHSVAPKGEDDVIALLTDESSGVRRVAARALGWTLVSKAASELAKLLRDPDERVVQDAADALLTLPREDVLPHLLPLVSATEVAVHDRVRGMIKVNFWGFAHPHLLPLLNHEDAAVRRFVMEVLRYQHYYPRKCEEVMPYLSAPDLEVRAAIWTAASNLEDPAFIPKALEWVRSSDGDLRDRAAAWLVYKASSLALDGARTLLAEESPRLKGLGALLIASMDAYDAVPDQLPLIDHEDAETRKLAINAVARWWTFDAVPAIRKRAKDGDPEVRRAAVEALAQLDPRRSADALADAVRDESEAVRLVACRELVDAGFPEGAAALTPALTDPDEQVRFAALAGLAKLDPATAAARFIELLKSPEPERRRDVCKIAADLNWKDVDAHIADLLNDEDPSVRETAAAALDLVEPVKNLLVKLKDPSAPARRSAVRDLGRCGSVSALPAIVELLDDADSKVVGAVLETLAAWHPAEAAPLIRPLLKHKEPAIRMRATWLLGALADAASAVEIAAGLDDDANDVREQALHSLVMLGGDAAGPHLIKLLDNPEAAIRKRAIEALAAVGHPDLADIAIRMTKDPDQRVRLQALWTAGYLGDPALAPVVESLLSDSTVAESARWTLMEIQGSAAARKLSELLEDPTQELLNKLGRTRAFDALPKIAECLDFPDGQVQTAAFAALAELDGKEFIPKIVAAIEAGNRFSAVEALGRLEAREYAHVLIPLLREKNVNRSVLEALSLLHHPEALPEIIKLVEHSDREIRERAVTALRGYDAERVGPLLVERLGDRDSFVSSSARVVLHKLRPKSIVPRLQAYIKEGHWMKAWDVMGLLVAIRGDDAIEDLKAAFKVAGFRFPATNSLKSLSADAAPKIAELLEWRDPSVVAAAVDALAYHRAKAFEPAIRRLLESDFPVVREAAARAIEAFDPASAIPRLTKGLAAPKWDERVYCLKSLAEIDPERAAEVAVAWLTDLEVEVRRAALQTLGDLKRPDTASAIRRCLEDRHPGVRLDAVRACASLGGADAVASLIPLLSDPSDPPEGRGGPALNVFDDYSEKSHFTNRTRVRLETALALCRLGAREGVDPALRESRDSCPLALFALNGVRCPETWGKLKKLAVKDVGGDRWRDFLERLAAAAGLRLEIPSRLTRTERDWLSEQVWYPASSDDSALEYIEGQFPDRLQFSTIETPFNLIFESDRICLIPSVDARPFWLQWRKGLK